MNFCSEQWRERDGQSMRVRFGAIKRSRQPMTDVRATAETIRTTNETRTMAFYANDDLCDVSEKSIGI